MQGLRGWLLKSIRCQQRGVSVGASVFTRKLENNFLRTIFAQWQFVGPKLTRNFIDTKILQACNHDCFLKTFSKRICQYVIE